MGITIKVKHPNAERRSGRLVVEGATAVYHVVNRTARREKWFEDRHKAIFIKILQKQAAFSGVEVLSYCIMGNHFHLLIRIPHVPDERIDDEELMRRFEALYKEHHPFSVPEPEFLHRILKENGELADEWRERLKNRMGRLDAFMSELKQRFMIWYNKNYNNEGTIFAQTYRSTLIEDHWHALSVVSAYIDLNPVRAKLVTNPAEYQYCGYAALMAGDKLNNTNLEGIYRSREDETGNKESPSNDDLLGWYRLLLFDKGSRPKAGASEKENGQDSGFVSLNRNKSGVIPEDIAKQVIERKGKPALNEVLRHKIRYFSKGAIIGSQAFVGELFEQNRQLFPPNRKSRGSPMRKGNWGDLHSFRNLNSAVDVEK